MWMVVSIILVVAIMVIIIMLLVGLGPDKIFGLFQDMMSLIALYLIASIHGVLR